MAQVNLFQYAEIQTGGGTLCLGNKAKASTISLTGTGEVYHRIWNDNSSWPLNVYDFNIITGPVKFIAIKSSLDAVLGIADTLGGGNNGTIPLEAGIWTFISGGTVLGYAGNLDTRMAESAIDIAYMSVFAAGSADVELLVAY